MNGNKGIEIVGLFWSFDHITSKLPLQHSSERKETQIQNTLQDNLKIQLDETKLCCVS